MSFPASLFIILVLSALMVRFAVSESLGVAVRMRLMVEDAAALGLDEKEAMGMGVAWAAAGFDKNRILAGVDTEADGYQYDNSKYIKRKVSYACTHGLGGVFSWRIDNDNRPRKGELPSFEGATQVFDEMQACSGCSYSVSAGWSCPDGRATPPVVGAYLAAFNTQLRSESKLDITSKIPFDKITRLFIAFVHVSGYDKPATKGRKCAFGYFPGNPKAEMSEADVRKLIARARRSNPSIEIYATSGLDRATYEHCDPKDFSASLLKFLKHWDLDGYDMDWENDIEQKTMNDLLCASRKTLRSAKTSRGKRFGISAAVWSSARQYDLPVFSKCVDVINIMSYGNDVVTLDKPVAEFAFAA